MKLVTLLTELTAGIKATIVKVDPDKDTFVIKLILPALQRIASKESIYYGDVATALATKDYEVDKKVGNEINIITSLIESVRNKETIFVSDTSLTELKTTAIGRLQGLATITAVSNVHEYKDENGNTVTATAYNTKKLKELGRSGNVIIYDINGLDDAKILYSDKSIETNVQVKKKIEASIEKIQAAAAAKANTAVSADSTDSNVSVKQLKQYDPAKIGIVDPVLEKIQQAIIDKFKNTGLINTSIYRRFIESGGADGKYGPATKDLIAFIQYAGNMTDQSGNVTNEFLEGIK